MRNVVYKQPAFQLSTSFKHASMLISFWPLWLTKKKATISIANISFTRSISVYNKGTQLQTINPLFANIWTHHLYHPYTKNITTNIVTTAIHTYRVKGS